MNNVNILILERDKNSNILMASMNGTQESFYIDEFKHYFKKLNLFIIEAYSISDEQTIRMSTFSLKLALNELKDFKKILDKRFNDKITSINFNNKLVGLNIESIITNKENISGLSELFDYEIIEDRYPEYYI